MLAYGGAHVAALAPLASALIAQDAPVLFLALTTACAHLDYLGLEYISYRDMPGAQDARVQELGRKLLADLPQVSVVPVEDSIAYMGLNYQDLVMRLGRSGAEQAYQRYGRQAFFPVALFKRWLLNVQPKLLVATNAPRSECAALKAARVLRIPSVCLISSFAEHAIKRVVPPGYASKICVLNEQMHSAFIKQGCKPETLVVTGNPIFERLRHPIVQSGGCVLRQMRHWRDNETVVLWASRPEPARHLYNGKQGDVDFPRRIEERLREFIAKYEDFKLIVRYHPSEQGREFQKEQERVEQSAIDDDLAVLLNAVDVVVTLSTSIVGMEASLVGKPVISIRGSVCDDDMRTELFSIVKVPSSFEGLDEILLSNRRVGAYMSPRNKSFSKEKATQEVISVINSILG